MSSLLLLAALGLAQALSPEPTLQALVGASYNGLGAKAAVSPGVKLPLWNDEDNILFGDTFLHARLITDTTPSYSRLGPELRFSPIAVLELGAHYIWTPYFGTFTSLVGFDDPQEVYSPERLHELIDQGKRGSGQGTRYGADAVLQAMVGPIAIVFTGRWTRWSITPGAGIDGGWFFEPEQQLMLAWDDTVLDASNLLVYRKELEGRDAEVFAGTYTTWFHGQDTGDTTMRAGLVGLYKWDGHWSLAVLVQPYLVDRVWSTGVPYLASQLTWEL